MATVEELRQQLAQMESKMDLMSGLGVKSETLDVRAVSLKLPMFYEDRPERWFHYAECQFRLKKIVDDQTQFDHIYQSLTDKQSARVESLMDNPPKTGKVAAIKALLIRHFGRTQYEKDDELLNHGPLGSMTVLEFIGKVRVLNKDPATFLKAFVLNKIPASVRGTLANTEFQDLEEMAIAADKVLKAEQKSVNAIHKQEVEEIDAVTHRGTRSAPPNKPAQKGGASRGSCFYHDKHGPAAFKCEGNGCVWSGTRLAPKPSGNGKAGR